MQIIQKSSIDGLWNLIFYVKEESKRGRKKNRSQEKSGQTMNRVPVLSSLMLTYFVNWMEKLFMHIVSFINDFPMLRNKAARKHYEQT